MRNKFYVIAICWSVLALAQEKPTLVTDRPSMSEASINVPAGALQIETGSTFETLKSKSGNQNEINFNTTAFKYGLSKSIEVRAVVAYEGIRFSGKNNLHRRINSVSPFVLGTKLRLLEKKGFRPDVSLIAHFSLPVRQHEFISDGMTNKMCLSATHSISESISIGYNASVNWDNERSPFYLYTIIGEYSFSEKFIVFGEFYSYNFSADYNYFDVHTDGGIIVKITPVFQYDLSMGVGLSPNEPDYFIDSGISLRMFK